MSGLGVGLSASCGTWAQGATAKCSKYRSGGPFEDTGRPLQEIYSLRCAPQVLGACRENLDHARRLVEVEINGVSDNPLFFEGPAVAHGGNFHGQQIAFAADALNAALVQVAVLAERQLDALVSPGVTNGHAPLLLAWEPGPHSGLAGAQLTATALVAEMRAHGGPAATLSIPTNGGNQDVVSMGTLAARLAYAQTERLAGVLGILALALTQYAHLQAHGKAPGAPTPPIEGLPEIAGLNEDRPLRDDIARLSTYLLA
jgi:tyrosine ammonia-lyase